MENKDHIDNTNYYAHISNDDLVTYFTQLLRSRMELVQYNYPGEFLEEDGAMIEHLNRCQGIFYEKLQGMLNTTTGVNGKYLSKEVKERKFEEKRKELSKLLDPTIEKYFEEVQVKYVEINADLIDIDFWGHDYSIDQDTK